MLKDVVDPLNQQSSYLEYLNCVIYQLQFVLKTKFIVAIS